MRKYVLLGNNESKIGQMYNSVDGYKEEYTLCRPNQEDIVRLTEIFGSKNSSKIIKIVTDIILSLEGCKYKPYFDFFPLGENSLVFIMKDLEHNVSVSILKNDIVYTVLIGHRDGNVMSFMRLYKYFFDNLPTVKN